MTNHTYSISEIVSSSPDGVDAAIRSAVERAAQTIRNIHWFEVVSVRGQVSDAGVLYQVTLKLGFRLEDAVDRV